MSAKSKRFAQRVEARMRLVGLHTHDDIKEKGGPSSPTMTKILGASDQPISLGTFKKLERALQLTPGSASVSYQDDADLVPASKSVGGGSEDGDTLLYRRPDGITDEKWREITARTRSLVEWEIQQAMMDG